MFSLGEVTAYHMWRGQAGETGHAHKAKSQHQGNTMVCLQFGRYYIKKKTPSAKEEPGDVI